MVMPVEKIHFFIFLESANTKAYIVVFTILKKEDAILAYFIPQ
jgi:hypothetical protein